MLDCPVSAIDHSGKRLRIETSQGAIAADQVIVTVPSAVLAAERIAFTPALPEKIEAARGLPLGLRRQAFHLARRCGGIRDRDPAVRAHRSQRHRRLSFAAVRLADDRGLFRRRLGRRARGKRRRRAFFDFAVSELVGLFGSDFARRLKPIRVHRWAQRSFRARLLLLRLPGYADCRQTLAEPVDNRLFFAGEACSPHDFSTAHGGYLTGVAAAEQVIALRARLKRNTSR